MKYSSDDMDKMQQDAVKRIQEMQNRNRNALQNNNKSSANENTAVMSLPPPEKAVQNHGHSSCENTPNNFFEMLFGDKEKSLILLLILILSSEKKGDTSLIFALIYLLL